MMHEWWEGWGLGGVGFGSLIWPALFALLIIGIASFWLRSVYGGEKGGPRVPPRQILDERFAKGEIEKDEYEERLHALRD